MVRAHNGNTSGATNSAAAEPNRIGQVRYLGRPEENYALACQEYEAGRTVVETLAPTLVFGLTTQCNNQIPCLICDRNVRDRSVERDTNERVIAAMVPLIKTARLLLLHTGGEAMMSKFFDDVMALADPPTKVCFATNAMLMDHNRADRMLERDIMGKLVVSLDAATAETYRVMRPGSAFERVVDNIRYYIARAGQLGRTDAVVELNMTLCKSNLADVAKLPELAGDVGAGRISFQRLNDGLSYIVKTVDGQDWVYQDQLAFDDPPAVDRLLLDTYRRAKAAGMMMKYMGRLDPTAFRDAPDAEAAEAIQCFRSFEDEDGGGQPPADRTGAAQCDKGWKQVNVMPDGNVRVCCYHVMADARLGNVQTDDFMALWNSEQMVRYRADCLSGKWPEVCLRTPAVCTYRGRR